MTDQTGDMVFEAERSALSRRPTTEFTVYFAIIFAATLPLACLTWGLQLIKQGSVPEKGPIARAWTQARIITPMIFSA